MEDNAKTIQKTLDRIGEERLIAVLREDDPGIVAPLIETFFDHGVKILEITLTTPGAIDQIARTVRSIGRQKAESLVVGAGSVRTLDQLRMVADAGGVFAASPVTDARLIEEGERLGLLMMPGALTPNEIVHAHNLGARLIKVFPMPQAGTNYFHSLLGPLPDIRLAPSGGVGADNGVLYLKDGAFAVNVGSFLAPMASDRAARCAFAGLRVTEMIGSLKTME